MKRKLAIASTMVVAMLATSALGQTIVPGDSTTYPSIGIVNSPHNLNNFTGVTVPGNRVCMPCHTPHNASVSGQLGALWNHAVTQETFIMYSSTAGQPEAPSKLCLSCHDGVTAIDNYGGVSSSGIVMTGGENIGTDLSNDHPIGVAYPTNNPVAFNDPTGFAPGIGGGPGVQLVTINGLDRVECTSCHQVHNNGLGSFLRVPIEQSYLCLQCHNK